MNAETNETMVKWYHLGAVESPGYACLYNNPFQFRQSVEREMMTSGGHGNSNGPHHDPRDSWVLFGTIIGVIICCTAGAIIGGILTGGLGGVFIGIVVGLLVGGFVGSYLGELVKRKKSTKLKKVSEGKTGRPQGPFIQ
jgi:hypothetical protein